MFYGVCQQGSIATFRAPILANEKELAKLDCKKYFYTVVEPGSYRFCATTRKCKLAVLSAGTPYYFRISAKNDSWIEQVTAETGQAEMQSMGAGPIDPQRVTSPEFVTADPDRPPPSVLPAMLPPAHRE